MFTFIKQYAERVTGAHIYAFISLMIFFVFFVVLLLLVKKMGKERVTELKNLPFSDVELNESSSYN